MWEYILCCDGCGDRASDDLCADKDGATYSAGIRKWKKEESNQPYEDDDWWFCPRCQLARSSELVPILLLTAEPT